MKFTAALLIIAYLVSPALAQQTTDVDPKSSEYSHTAPSSKTPTGNEIPTDQGFEELSTEGPLVTPSATDSDEEAPSIPTEPRSVAAVVESVVDLEGNEYLVLVVQPTQLVPTMATEEYTVKVPYTELTSFGEEVTKTKTATKTRTIQLLTASAKSAVLIPLLKSMPCYVLKDSSRVDATDLKIGQHLLVAGSKIEALQVLAEVRKAASEQVKLTGISPQLPKFIVALSDKPKSEQSKSLFETLTEASPYQSKATFFNDMKLSDPSKLEDSKGKRFRTKHQAAIAWIKARQDFFSNRYDRAEPMLDALIEMDTKEPLVHYLRGIIRFDRGDSDGASLDFANGAELESTRGQSTSINHSLERVQGVARQALEEYRHYYRTSGR